MNTIRKTILLCTALLAAGALAAQTPASPAMGQSGQSTQPGQQQEPQTGTQPGQTAPGTTQPGQPGQQPQAQQAGRPTIDDQVKMLTQDLNLTPEQQTKMRGVLEDQHKQAMTIVNDTTLSRDDKVQKIHTLREGTIARARALLNPDQQKKLDDMLQESDRLHPQGPNNAPSGTTSPGGTPPGSTQPGSTPPGSTRPPQ